MIIITLLVRTASLSCLNTPCLTSYGSGHSICISILHLGTAQPYPMVQLPGENRSTMLGQGFPGVSLSKESICNTGDPGSIPGRRRSPGEGNCNSIQYSCLENSKHGKPGGLQSMELHRVEHDWATNTFTSLFTWEALRIFHAHI